MSKYAKGDRVGARYREDGERKNVLGVVMGTKSGKVTVVLDGTFDADGSARIVKAPEESPAIWRSDQPLPVECQHPADDPMLQAGYTFKFVTNGGPRDTDDGYTYEGAVYRNGKKTGITMSHEGMGGEMNVHTYGVGPTVVKEFEAAIEQWRQWKGATEDWFDAEMWVEEFIADYDFQKKGLSNRPWSLVAQKFTPMKDQIGEDDEE